MEVVFTIKYHKKVLTEDIVKLSSANKKRIQKSIEEKLMTKPHIFSHPLHHSLRGYKKLRIGDYRVVFRIEGHTVIVVCIAHRGVVYNNVNKRT